MTEIEWKYRLPDAASLAELRQLERLGTLVVGEFRTRHLTDTYYDTADRRLMTAGYALRHRREGTHDLTQLKALGGSDGPIHRRAEFEFVTERPEQPTAWPEGPHREIVLAAVGAELLQPVLVIAQTRHEAPLRDGADVVATLSLDEVRWQVGDRVEEGWEVEIELAPDADESLLVRLSPAPIEALGGRPESRSKYERGLELLRAASDQAMPAGQDQAAFTPHGIRFALNEPATALLQRIITVQASRLHKQYDGVIKGEDPEAVHDARVAARRMRSALFFFAPWLPAKVERDLRRRLRKLGRILGPVRDLDVGLLYLHEHAAILAPEAEAPLRRHLETQRERARADMLAYYRGKGYRQLRKTLDAFIHTPLPTRERLGDVLPGLVETAIAEIGLYEDTLVPGCPDEHFHALRIACKRLRYLLEFTRYRSGPTGERLIALLTQMQDRLGDIHDAHVGSSLAFGLLRDPQTDLRPAERAALVRYGLGLRRLADEMTTAFLDPHASPPLWSLWQSRETRAALAEVKALLGHASVPSP
ncbi:MAG: CHAD domain-containing protein [Caldilineales bacterium]|nr:CHAD domain-containing protein [Caldilineales bacterium]